jgi:hypothetical protein
VGGELVTERRIKAAEDRDVGEKIGASPFTVMLAIPPPLSS